MCGRCSTRDDAIGMGARGTFHFRVTRCRPDVVAENVVVEAECVVRDVHE